MFIILTRFQLDVEAFPYLKLFNPEIHEVLLQLNKMGSWEPRKGNSYLDK